MDAPYWVADYLVDPSRNQITHSKNTLVLQPKVIAVLNVLARNAGQVVSHDELMQKVWPDTFVGSNTLQRCIAELRKALGDNSRTQTVIKTHSKQGYSLEVQVRLNEGKVANRTPILAFPNFITFSVIASLFALVAVAFISKKSDAPVAFNSITPLTATDEKEYFPDYSPDGKYMVFHRYLGICDNHIWAKDLSTKQEFQLTQASAVYGSHSWSDDGNQLVFVKQKNCSYNQQAKSLCWELHALDFAEALSEARPTTKLLDCGSRRISDPQWLNDGRILVLEHGDENRILQYQLGANNLDVFYADGKSISHFTVSHNGQKVAVFQREQTNQYTWSLLNIRGEEQTKRTFLSPEMLSAYTSIEPTFAQDDESFIVNTTQGLFSLSFDGAFTPIPTGNTLKLFEPTIVENGKKILATQGMVDADVAMLELDSGASISQTIARSNSYDVGAIFQPNGEAIAFRSQRSGSAQVWLINGDAITQLSDFNKGEWIRSLVWAANGQTLATIANDTIYLLGLNGHSKPVRFGFPVNSIYQWIGENQLLIKGFYQGKEQLLLANINDSSVISTTIGDVVFAHMTEYNALFFVDKNRKAWVKRGAQMLPIHALDNHLDSKRFFAQQGLVYGVNWRHQLWQYDIANNQMTILQSLPEDVWWINDIRDKRLSVTTLVSSRHEIIELSTKTN